MQRIRNWPRWIRFGLLSALAAIAFTIIGILGEQYHSVFAVFTLGMLAPSWLLLFYGPFDIVDAFSPGREVVVLSFVPIIWFLIGGLLGRYIKNALLAVGIWVGVLVAGVIYIGYFS